MSLLKKNLLRSRQMLGKYRIQRLIGNGGFAQVYSATDTIEGIRVALKIPFAHYVDNDLIDLFKQEVRLVSRLDHPNILPIKNADFIDGRFVVVSRLGDETLESRLERRISVRKSISFFEQMISAVAAAHEKNILHCDIKPGNFLIFDGETVMLTDFGIAKVSRMTIEGSGTGTVGHMAPEQAMGRPSKRSDVFSLGLIMYRMLSGKWPEYPFDWPPRGVLNMKRKRVHPELIRFIRKSIEPRPSDRFVDAIQMENRFEDVSRVALRNLDRKRR